VDQLDLFEILRPLAANGRNDAVSPSVEMPLLDLGNAEPQSPEASGDAEPDDVEMIAGAAAARDFPDAGVSDADDLRRLEESIRWLMNAGTVPLPRTTPLPPLLGLSPLHPHDADSLLLDPETLFTPRAPRRASTLAAGAAKFLLVSAIAAPTAYFVASWMQFPGSAAPSDPAEVSGAVKPVAVAAMEPAVAKPQVAQREEIPMAPQSEQTAVPQQAARVPQQAAIPQPASRAAEVVVAALQTGPKAAPEPPSVAMTPPAEAVSPPMPMPAMPALRQEEVANVAAARLFFRRAANAGDAAAAIAMGATYDPEVLSQRFIHGIEADAHEAQKWYEKAREMGRHIEMLAQSR
jgi:hypothetical protein